MLKKAAARPTTASCPDAEFADDCSKASLTDAATTMKNAARAKIHFIDEVSFFLPTYFTLPAETGMQPEQSTKHWHEVYRNMSQPN